MTVTTGCSNVFFSKKKIKKINLFGFSWEGLCLSWLILPILLSRATHSSYSTMMGMQKLCPCGCAGCLRNGDQPKDHSELDWLTAARKTTAHPGLAAPAPHFGLSVSLDHILLKIFSRSINKIFQDICCCLSLTTTLRNFLPTFLLLLSNLMSSDYLQLNCTQP